MKPFLIPPHERYDQHIHKADIGNEQLSGALSRLGLSATDCNATKLSGGFQNSNYLINSGSQKFVIRFYSTDKETAMREFGVLSFLADKSVAAPKIRSVLNWMAKLLSLWILLRVSCFKTSSFKGKSLIFESFPLSVNSSQKFIPLNCQDRALLGKR